MPKLICNNCSNELDYKDNQHLYSCPECDEGQLEKVEEDEGTPVTDDDAVDFPARMRCTAGEDCNDEVQYDEAVDNNGLRVCKNCGDVFYGEETEADPPPKDVKYCCDHCKITGDVDGRSLHDLGDKDGCDCKGMTCDYGGYPKDSRLDIVQKIDSMTMCCGERMTYDELEVGCDVADVAHWGSPYSQSMPVGPYCMANFVCSKCGMQLEFTIRGEKRTQQASEYIQELIDA